MKRFATRPPVIPSRLVAAHRAAVAHRAIASRRPVAARRRMLAALLFVACSGTLFADVPVKHEQVVYSVTLDDGTALQSTFAVEGSGPIYLLAGVDNFVSLWKTLVYYWPLTREWKTDTDSLDAALTGTLVLKGPTGVRLSPVDYTYRSSAGRAGMTFRVYTRDEARRAWEDFQQRSQAASKAMIAYTDEENRLNAERGRLIEEIRSLLRDGKGDEAKLLVARYNALAEPPPPPRLDYEVRQLAQAFDLKLAPGTYDARLVDSTGATLEGSEKRIVVFAPGATGSVGYDVIPGDRWTRPEESTNPRDVLYVNGASTLYLRPFSEREFNDLAYARMVDNQAAGSPRLSRWVRSGEVESASLRVRAAGAAARDVAEKPFFVQQLPGGSLGYTIVPFDPSAAEQQGQSPSLVAYALPSGAKRLHFSLVGADGRRLAGSERELRVVRPAPAGGFLLLVALLPLPALVVPLVWRHRVTHARR